MSNNNNPIHKKATSTKEKKSSSNENINIQGTKVQASDSTEYQTLLEEIENDKIEIKTPHQETKNKNILLEPKIFSRNNQKVASNVWNCFHIIKKIPSDDIIYDFSKKQAEVGQFCCNLCGKFITVASSSGNKSLKNHILNSHKHLAKWIENGMKEDAKFKTSTHEKNNPTNKVVKQSNLLSTFGKLDDEKNVLKLTNTQCNDLIKKRYQNV